MNKQDSSDVHFNDLISPFKEKTSEKKKFFEMKDIFPNYHQFENIEDKIMAKAIEPNQLVNNGLIETYLNFVGAEIVGFCSFMSVLTFKIAIISNLCAYFTRGYWFSNLIILGLVALLLAICLLYPFINYYRKEKQKEKENLENYNKEENKNLLKEKQQINENLNKNYLKDLLVSSNKYMDNLKNKYIDEMSNMTLKEIQSLKVKLENDLKIINLNKQQF